MMANDWFRDPAWDEANRAQFEQRLKRARAWSRPQYIRIKGLALRDAGELDGAQVLFERVITEYPESLDAASAREHLGDLAVRTGRPVEAEAHIRALLADHPTLNATTGLAELALAELLIEHNDEPSRIEARSMLDAVGRRLKGIAFNDARFRWFVAQSALASQTGQLDEQQEAAQAALSLVGQAPQFPRHPTVGLVDADQPTLLWLHKAAVGPMSSRDAVTPPWTTPSRHGTRGRKPPRPRRNASTPPRPRLTQRSRDRHLRSGAGHAMSADVELHQ